MGKDKVFHADQIRVGHCSNKKCDCVHVQLLDADGTVRAQAAISCSTADALAADLKSVAVGVLSRSPVSRHH